MEAIAVRCNHCGAGLDVDSNTRFVTCKFCQSQLEVKHTASSTFTEVVQRIAENTDRMAGNLKVIELQNELERVDREWEKNKEHFYVTDEYGRRPRASVATQVVAAIVLFIFTLIWMFYAVTSGASPQFVILGVVVTFAIIIAVFSSFDTTAAGKLADENFAEQRAALLSKISAERDKCG